MGAGGDPALGPGVLVEALLPVGLAVPGLCAAVLLTVTKVQLILRCLASL